MNKYDHNTIEEKWMKKWEENNLFQNTSSGDFKNKLYLLFAFAYPSGEGLHVGHVESKTALDILARYNRMIGKDVFFPVGWDAFGLPAENYAVKTGIHPEETTKKAIKTFSRQIKRVGISYDWSTEIAACHPEYYKWTQWLFLKLYEKGLAYKSESSVNWCSSCQTVLANEQVVEGECERCGTEVVQKEMEQWFFKISEYRDELIKDLEKVDWPEYTKQKQVNWIGRSEGASVQFKIKNTSENLEVFTTRPDTIYGATFMVIAPENPILDKIVSNEQKANVEEYIKVTQTKTEEDRLINKDKTGVFTGAYAINPINDEEIPIWISDYVLMGYGTGAIMAVPAHDDRDYQFAEKYELPVIPVVELIEEVEKGETVSTDNSQIGSKSESKSKELPFPDEGISINSEAINGLSTSEAKKKITEIFEEKGFGKSDVTYRLRDWLVSRQRYWGDPIPIVYDPKGNPHPVKEEHLPWKLPTDVDFEPTGESPLTKSKEFKERVEKLYGEGWAPEYDTMDTFVDSSWYYLRYTDARNDDEFASVDQLKKLMPVDFYMIGPEHTVLHLLYSRFFTKFLRDEGYLQFDEPFIKMRHQGMILGPDNKKMSKSKGNVINPDEIVNDYGADTLRVYEMFMGPIDADKPWDTNGVKGIRKFIMRINNLCNDEDKVKSKIESTEEVVTEVDNNDSAGSDSIKHELHNQEIEVLLNKTIKKVSEDIPNLKYNTAIAKLMEFINEWEKNGVFLTVNQTLSFLKLLSPFAPFITDELFEKLVNKYEMKDKVVVKDDLISIHIQSWPEYDKNLAKDETFDLAIQVNGKVRGLLNEVSLDITEEEVNRDAAKEVERYLDGKEIVKFIYVPTKIINFVVKDN